MLGRSLPWSMRTISFTRMRELMSKYADRPMDLPDAALLRVAEREAMQKIFTVDRKDLASIVFTGECDTFATALFSGGTNPPTLLRRPHLSGALRRLRRCCAVRAPSPVCERHTQIALRHSSHLRP